MRRKVIRNTVSGLFLTVSGWAQTTQPKSETVPIYHVTVVDRAVVAVNYQYRKGPTKIDFRGTVLLPQAKGDATVESKRGRTEVDASFQQVETPARFGPEYLTYVLWAITPEGQAKNLGEVSADGSDKAHLRVTTDLQVFGLVVTAEPYSSVRLPSDVVVLENQVRPDTIGSTQPIRARFELLPRGTYTYNVPADVSAFSTGPKVSMSEYEQIVGVYQAQNALQIARSQGAAQYAPEVMEKAEREFRRAQQLQADKAGRSQVVSAAREAAQTAEDARALAVKRKQDAELVQTREQLARERQLRADAEAAAQRANAQPDREPPPVVDSVPPPPPPPAPAPVQQSPAPRTSSQPDENRRELDRRVNLYRQLHAAVETLDTSRGLVVLVHDADFRGSELSPSPSANLARVAAMIAAEPGLKLEVEGYVDAAGTQAENLAEDRARAVRDALVAGGLHTGTIPARGMGNNRPLTSNATAAGREQNRRVEVVITGDAIGTLPAWQQTYTLNVGE
jgi:outer membrane protein OmpA-like peptidoglycan-associated protein